VRSLKREKCRFSSTTCKGKDGIILLSRRILYIHFWSQNFRLVENKS
jgi:hypothetical protein